MRLWTIQPEKIFEKLKAGKTVHCDPAQSELLTSCEFSLAYDWMAEQLSRRIGPPPPGVCYPIWAWHTLDWLHQPVNLRLGFFRNYREPMACIELEIPDSDVLLSNEDMWHIVLNDGYYGDCQNEQESQQEDQWFDALPPQEQELVKRASWEKIFDVFPARETDWDCHGKYVQAVFWELRPDQVVSVRHFAKNAKKRPLDVQRHV